MRRTVVVTTAWITATVLAVSLAFAGVNAVADRVLDPEPSPLIGSAALDDDPSDSPSPDDSPEDVPSPDDTPSDTASEPDDEPTASASGTSASPTSSPRATASPRPASSPSDDDSEPDDEPTPSPTPSATPSATSSPTPSPTSTSTSVSSQTRTYRLVGGTVTVRFSSSEVRVVSATPNEGFSLHEIEQPAPTVIDLEFRAHDDSHRSKLDAWWQDGPRERIREETRD